MSVAAHHCYLLQCVGPKGIDSHSGHSPCSNRLLTASCVTESELGTTCLSANTWDFVTPVDYQLVESIFQVWLPAYCIVQFYIVPLVQHVE